MLSKRKVKANKRAKEDVWHVVKVLELIPAQTHGVQGLWDFLCPKDSGHTLTVALSLSRTTDPRTNFISVGIICQWKSPLF